MCIFKKVGGLGFGFLKTFNIALLAKQGWRMLQEPHSLIFQVFKTKYFPHCDFMKANLSHRTSYAWCSIASARSVLKLRLRWHIGDGKSVRIKEDPWRPLSNSFRLHSDHNVLEPNERVDILINEDTLS
jgi:hypothetical protein